MIALQKRHHANQTEAAQRCREGTGPAAPWDGPSLWAAGTSASRGVVLLFNPSPLLSGATSAAIDPNGRVVAVKYDLSGSRIAVASVYALEGAHAFHPRQPAACPAGWYPPCLGGGTGTVWPMTRSLGVSQAPVRQAFSTACCRCSKLWGCGMRSAPCTPKQGSSPTQPPQAHHQPKLTDDLSQTACFQMSAQLQSQTSGPLTIMRSLCQSPPLLHPHLARRVGKATQHRHTPFFVFFLGRDRYSLHKCNDKNLEEI